MSFRQVKLELQDFKTSENILMQETYGKQKLIYDVICGERINNRIRGVVLGKKYNIKCYFLNSCFS